MAPPTKRRARGTVRYVEIPDRAISTPAAVCRCGHRLAEHPLIELDPDGGGTRVPWVATPCIAVGPDGRACSCREYRDRRARVQASGG